MYINQCGFYGNIFEILCQIFLHIATQLKAIHANFIKCSGEKDIVCSLTYKCIVTMDINQYGFYGNIFTILSQIFLIYSYVT